MLPGVDGFEMVRRLRRDGNRVPVIFLTAKDAQEDKITGLTIGGDDYVTKPFGLEELAARVRTVLRRTRPARPGPCCRSRTSRWTRTPTRWTAAAADQPVADRVPRCCATCMLHPGRVLTRAQLLDHVWDYDFGGSSTVVSTYVAYLRRKLAERRAGAHPHPARPSATACACPAPARQTPARARASPGDSARGCRRPAASLRLLRGQLRLRVMASVVAVTLIALVAFDASAVAIMRRHLLNQTDTNLRVALNLARPRLNALWRSGSRPGTGRTTLPVLPAPGPAPRCLGASRPL